MKVLIIGGNRFFGKKLAQLLLKENHEVTLLNRGNLEDGFEKQIERIKCDRKDNQALAKALNNRSWDVVYDQVCFDANEAKSAVEIFKNKTGHYIFTSSQSVYNAGKNLKEEIFDPLKHTYSHVADRNLDYAEAKRQCETEFFKDEALPVTAVRFPMVVGEDDYTKRFHFHIERILNNKEIYFPNINAKLSLISSDDAAAVLNFLATNKVLGPINAASKEPLTLSELIHDIESIAGTKASLSPKPNEENHSPYGISSDWYMNTEKLLSLGFEPRPIKDWLAYEIKTVISRTKRF